MSLNGKRDDFDLADFKACAKLVSMKRGRAESIVEQVDAAVKQWPAIAEEVGVNSQWIAGISENHRLTIL